MEEMICHPNLVHRQMPRASSQMLIAPSGCAFEQSQFSWSRVLEYEYHINVYGQRKRILYAIFIFLALITMANCALCLWLYTLIAMSLQGPINLHAQHFHSSADAIVYKAFATKHIVPKVAPAIHLRNIHQTKDASFACTSRISLQENNVQAFAEQVVLNDQQGRLLFMQNDMNFIFNLDKLQINDSALFRLTHALQTPFIQSNSSLKLQSLSRKLRVLAGDHLQIQANQNLLVGGDKFGHSIHLQSLNGSIHLMADEVKFSGLPSYLPSHSGSSYPQARSLCICSSGQLFMAPSSGLCTGTDICT